jgi:hypothetical protein
MNEQPSGLPSTGELEARMRPGGLSLHGFLGPDESLGEVLAADSLAVERMGVTFEKLAASLEALIEAANASPAREAIVNGKYRIRIQQYLGFQICPWSPDPRHMQCTGRAVHLSSLDWRVQNLETGQALAGPGLIVHLMHDHHFCEGNESPYRVDPTALAELLGLV